MPRRQAASHVHKLKKHKYASGNAMFFCTLPDCHYKVEVPLSLGKRTLCNICSKEFIINEYTLKLVKPHCANCGKVKTKDGRFIKKISNQIFTGIAESANQDLRSRLEAVAGNEMEDDI